MATTRSSEDCYSINNCQSETSDDGTNMRNAHEYFMFEVDESVFQQGYVFDVKWDCMKILYPDDYQNCNSESSMKQSHHTLTELSTAVAWPSSTNPFQIHDCVSTTWSVQTPIPSIGQDLPLQSISLVPQQVEFVPVRQPINSFWNEPFEYQQPMHEVEIELCTSTAIPTVEELIEETEEFVLPDEEFYRNSRRTD